MSGYRAARAVWALAALTAIVAGPRPAHAATEAELQSAVFRAKPAVVMIGVEVGATVDVRCSSGEQVRVRPDPLRWIGSGSIVHPEGWVVTNAHVVQPFHDRNEAALGAELLDKAVVQACPAELEPLGGDARAARIQALAAQAASPGGVAVEKQLMVNLSNGRMYPAELKAYSPPVYVEVGTAVDASGHTVTEYGKDVALLKIAERNLPVVRLAAHSRALNLGQSLFVIGFPGVVASHELLSKASQFEPSVTVGRVSGFKQDVGGHRVIQTDAAIIQGNSGGPVFDERGDVIGAATFTSRQGDQVVQGFNFLIPVESLREVAHQAGVTPQGESAFTRLWNRGVGLYVRELHARAYRSMDAASKLHPGFPDVERVKEACQIKHAEQPYLDREEVQWSAIGAGLIGAIGGLWLGLRRLRSAARRAIQQIIREELEPLDPRRS